ncbi:MAG: hypothetical protein HUU16_05645 [Candidatus Omnitrophica bacterium]|nr:hypothetical protein [Candidatus Omnitrophota bacterium]
MSWIRVFTVALSLALSANAVGSTQADHYRLECTFYRVIGNFDGETSLTDPIWVGIGDPAAESDPAKWIRRLNEDEGVSFFNIADLIDLGGAHFVADATGWTWNGASEPPKSGGIPRVEMLVAPKVINRFGQDFVVAIGPSESLEYFEKEADGLYRVRKSDLSTGVKIGAGAVERGPSERVILRDFEVSVSTVEDREELPGTTLDVGKPIGMTQTFKRTFSVQPGLNYGIRIQFDNYGTLLVRLRVGLE